MQPSIDLRIASMMRALADVILPAVAHDSFATEQATLLLGHLHVLRTQADHAPRYEALMLRAVRALAGGLAAQAQGGPKTQAAADRLRALTAEEAGTPVAVRDLHERTNAAIEALVLAVWEDGAADCRATVMRTVVAFGRDMASCERSWFAGIGFEGAGSGLDDMATMLAGLEARPG